MQAIQKEIERLEFNIIELNKETNISDSIKIVNKSNLNHNDKLFIVSIIRTTIK